MQLQMFLSRLGCLTAFVALTACGGTNAPAPAPTAAPAAKEEQPPAADLKAAAKTMVQAGMIKSGDKVLISGSVRDNELLEHLAVETMKAGAQPLITLGSDHLARRSFDEVPTSYDSLPQTLGMALWNTFEVLLSVDLGESENVMAGVPAARLAARAKAGQAVNEAFLKRGVRSVNLGNGLYPTAALAGRLGKTQAEVASIFWKAAMVSPETLRSKGEALRTALATAKQVTLSSANGTNLTFGVIAAKGFVSDGAITADKVKQGYAATQTWLPAGELAVPVALGTAEGKVVVDKLVFQGTTIEALTLVFSKGKLTSMTAQPGLDALKALYDASSGGKDQFAYIDLGLNPEATLPTNTGRVVWMAPGGVTIGLGDNTGWGGTNVSNFGLAGAVSSATLAADEKVLIENGTLK
jgi:leucyl aminopeptidase (aminopeptidase T)